MRWRLVGRVGSRKGTEVGACGNVRDWMRARCSSLAKNWRSSVLSLSLSFSMSDWSMLKSVEDMLGSWAVGSCYGMLTVVVRGMVVSFVWTFWRSRGQGQGSAPVWPIKC